MNPKLKILFPVGTLYPNESGGVSLSLYWLLKGLYATEKIDLTTITSSYGIKSDRIVENKWLDTDYGKVIYLKTNNINLGIPIIRSFIKKVNNSDIVHLSSFFYPPSIVCFFISILFKKKIVWSSRGSLDDIEFKKNGFFKKLTIFFLKPFLKKIAFHTTSSEETYFVRKYIGKNTNIFQITNFIVIPQKHESLKEFYFLYIGRFHQKKGIDNLLRALSNSKSFLTSKFTLKIAGNYDNEYGRYILNMHKELNLDNKVQFLGHIDGLEKQLLLAKAYFLFMPSYSENFGISAVEALSQGTPVVASINTPWESLNHYEAGYWVNNSPEILTDIIEKIVAMPLERHFEYSQNALKLVHKELDIFNNINIWIDSYNSINSQCQ